MRGRKRQPTQFKVLRGNPGKRPLNAREPKHDQLAVACPDEITDDAARAEWDRVTRQLVTTAHVASVDRATLIGYCVKYAQWLALEAEAKRHPFVVATPTGYPIPNPALGMANKVFSLMLKAAAELGITPSSRSRVVAGEPQEVDPLEAALG